MKPTSLKHPLKARSPTFVNEFGTITFVSDEQRKNVVAGMLVTPLGKEMLPRLEQELKTPKPSDFRESGKVIFARFEQLKNADDEIFVSPDGISTFVNEPHS